MVKKLFRWLIVSTVLLISLSGFTVYSAPLSSGGSGERTQVKDPVKVVCENGVMLGQSEEGVVSFKTIARFVCATPILFRYSYHT